jgi:hypothetical protein
MADNFRPRRQGSNWQNLKVRDFDNGDRWAILWDTVSRPDSETHNRAVEKSENAALDRARHLLRMGFFVYAIRDPGGTLLFDEAAIRQRLGLGPVAA